MYKVETDLNSPCGITAWVPTSRNDRHGVQQRFSNVSTQGNRLQRSKTQVARFQPQRVCFSKSRMGPENLHPADSLMLLVRDHPLRSPGLEQCLETHEGPELTISSSDFASPDWVPESASLTSSQVMPALLVPGSHFGQQGRGST